MARQFAVRRFVFASSLSSDGTHSPEECVSEEHRAYPEDLYGAATLYIERLGEAYRQQHALDLVSLRIGRVVGPGAPSKSSAWRSEFSSISEPKSPGRLLFPSDLQGESYLSMGMMSRRCCLLYCMLDQRSMRFTTRTVNLCAWQI
jgi:nucleoside-diphosphate-sugar epimerase